MVVKEVTQDVLDQLAALGAHKPYDPGDVTTGFISELMPHHCDINAELCRIYRDERIHSAVRAYGAQVEFLSCEPGKGESDVFTALALHPEHRMVLARAEGGIPGDAKTSTQEVYPLFMRANIVYFVVPSKSEAYSAAVDISTRDRDCRPRTWGALGRISPRLTGDHITQALQETLDCIVNPDSSTPGRWP